MMMRPGCIVSKQGNRTPNGWDRILELRLGAKGKGKLVHAVRYWPWSPRSVDGAWERIYEVARQDEIELLVDEID